MICVSASREFSTLYLYVNAEVHRVPDAPSKGGPHQGYSLAPQVSPGQGARARGGYATSASRERAERAGHCAGCP